jgi:molybdate transport system regulatory protein
MIRKLQLHGRVWLTLDGKSVVGHGRVELLRQIGATGSISKAAKAMKMSYKAAWDAVDAMNNAMGNPVVESATGGSKGGGSQLTESGKRLIAEFESMESRHREWLQQMSLDLPKRFKS